MGVAKSSPEIIGFGVYEADLRSGELRKNGIRLKLQEQPFHVLAMLLEHPGELVTREELKAKLWPTDTFVDFDNSLNTDINKVREALGDTAVNPRFVETIPRRGYRFIAPLKLNQPRVHGPAIGQLQPTVARRAWWRKRWLLAACAGLLVSGGLLLYLALRSRTPVTMRLTASLPSGLSFPDESGVAISPNGDTLVFVAQPAGGERRLYQRRFDEWDVHEIPQTLGAKFPFFSPDGQWVAFWRQSSKGRRAGELVKLSLRTGSVQAICMGWMISAGTWGLDDRIIFPMRQGKLLRVAASATNNQDCVNGETLVSWPPQTSLSYLGAEPIPGQDMVLITKRTLGNIGIYAMSLRMGTEQLIVPGGMHPHLAMGYLFFIADRSLKAVRFDAQRLVTVGPTRVIASGMNDYPLDEPYAVSDTGTLAVLRGFGASRTLVWRDRTGKTIPTRFSPRHYANPALSPDGTRIAVTVQEGPVLRIWVGSTTGEPLTPITFLGDEWYPHWSPDGKRIAFSSGATHDQNYRVFATAADGSGKPDQMADNSPFFPSSWSPKGDVLLATALGGPGRGFDIWQIFPRSGKKPQPFLNTEFGEGVAAFSPDGRWVAYESNESGQREVYVRAFPGGGSKQQISVDGGRWPTWRGDGREIFYMREDGTMMAVPTISAGRTLGGGTPISLFRSQIIANDLPRDYDVSADGQRFLMVGRREDAQPQIDVILGLAKELQGAPAEKQPR